MNEAKKAPAMTEAPTLQRCFHFAVTPHQQLTFLQYVWEFLKLEVEVAALNHKCY